MKLNFLLKIVSLVPAILNFLKVLSHKVSTPPQERKWSSKQIALDYILRYSGKWYLWGGNDPQGFDCSGLAVEYLKASGLVAPEWDTTAAGMWLIFKEQRILKPQRGCLVFWHSPNSKEQICHIEICLNEKLSYGASGGGSKIKTQEDAKKHDAFIKVRKMKGRPYIAGYVDPWKGISI